MDLTGGGAFNNLTPESVLEDLQGVNVIKGNPPYPPAWLLAINGSTGKAHRLDLSPSARNPLYRKGANDCTLTPTSSPNRRGVKKPAATF